MFRYLKGTFGVGLMYQKHEDNAGKVTGFTDSDYAGCFDTRRSLTRFMFKFGENIVSWKCNMHNVVSLSTTEVGFIVVLEAIKEAIWMKGKGTKLGAKEVGVGFIVTVRVVLTGPKINYTMNGLHT